MASAAFANLVCKKYLKTSSKKFDLNISGFFKFHGEIVTPQEYTLKYLSIEVYFIDKTYQTPFRISPE